MAKTKKLRVTCTEGKPQKVGDKLVTVRRRRGKRYSVAMEPLPEVLPVDLAPAASAVEAVLLKTGPEIQNSRNGYF